MFFIFYSGQIYLGLLCDPVIASSSETTIRQQGSLWYKESKIIKVESEKNKKSP